MTGERLTGIDKATLLTERMLGDSDTLRTLIIGGEAIEKIVGEAIAGTGGDPVIQACLLRTLIRGGAQEDPDRRKGTLAILTAEAMHPLIEANSAVLHETYIKAVKQQTVQSNQKPGSIGGLLDIGKIIAPHFSNKPCAKHQILDAWEQVAKQLPSEENSIRPKLQEIKEHMRPSFALDTKVEELRKAGLTNDQIATQLVMGKEKIVGSVHRLIVAGKIEKQRSNQKPGQGVGESATKLLEAIEEFQIDYPTGSFSFAEMARSLRISRQRVRQLVEKLGKTHAFPPKKGGQDPEYLSELDRKVTGLIQHGRTVKQIAEALQVPPTWVRTSIKRSTSQDRVQRAQNQKEFFGTVKQLRNQGNSISKIAKILERPKLKVKYAVKKLTEVGEIQKTRHRKSRSELPVFDAKVRELHAKGLTNLEIAQHLSTISTPVTLGHIQASIKRLQKGN